MLASTKISSLSFSIFTMLCLGIDLSAFMILWASKNMQINIFQQNWSSFQSLFFQKFFPLFRLFLVLPTMHILMHFKATLISLRLCSFFFFFIFRLLYLHQSSNLSSNLLPVQMYPWVLLSLFHLLYQYISNREFPFVK